MIELLIAMVLSTIVIAIVYEAFALVSQNYSKISGQFSTTTTALLLQDRLQSDCREASMAQLKDNELSVHRLDQRIVTYLLNDSFIIRNENNQIDSFAFRGQMLYSIRYLMNKEPAIEDIQIEIPVTRGHSFLLHTIIEYSNRQKLVYSNNSELNN